MKIIVKIILLISCLYSFISCIKDPLSGFDNKRELVKWYNNHLSDYIKLNGCNASCMYELFMSDSEEMIYWKINHNFREDVVWRDMSKEEFASQLNKYFNIPIIRFSDAKINYSDSPNCSLRVLFNEDAVSIVNVRDYKNASFKCIITGVQDPPISINGNRITVNNGWVAVEYNGEYPLYETGYSYSSGYTTLFEPSSLISDNGEKIELFGQVGYTESCDGINWSNVTPFVFSSGHTGHSHSSVNKVDGVYMMVGCTSNAAGTVQNPVYMDLWLSTDKVNWQWKGHLVSTNDNIGNGETFIIMGNSYLFKDSGGVYYLYYEGARESPKWETCLMTCSDLFYDRGNDFIGDWQQYSGNPIFPYNYNPFTGESAFCNPEFVKGEDNQPIKIEGRYYVYYLSGFTKDGVVHDTINRMYSYDLIHWVEEGSIFDNRDVADGGEGRGDNGDQSLCEFKGKSYLFYTHNMNSYGYGSPNIRYTIDDRPLEELMRLKP